jgi:F0F1-type ATP synthase assembly protein I
MRPGLPDPSEEPAPTQPGPADPPERLHPSLQPRGEAVAWSALGSLLAGPLVWGGVGYLADQWFGTGRLFTAIGVVGGSLTAFYIVYLRFGHDE